MRNEKKVERTIIHFDIDAFFASVEQIDFPEYRGIPIAVGGRSSRGVVATCSYEARKFGVHSAMSSVVAKKCCPNIVFVKPRMKRYTDISKKIFEYIKTIGCEFEKVSIDEAYLDITDFNIDAYQFAIQLKEAIYALTGLTISIGISYNKFLAKLASDWNKPNGIFEIKLEEVPQILFPLPITKVHGLGKKSCEKLRRIGIFTIYDLYHYPVESLADILGSSAAWEISHKIRGVDYRNVEKSTEHKSYGKETTFEKDVEDEKYLFHVLETYLEKIVIYLDENHFIAKTLTIKIKYYDFDQFTRSKSLEYHTSNNQILHNELRVLFNQINFKKSVRLIGLTVSNFKDESNKQFNFLEDIE